MYYGPELISDALRDWAKRHDDVTLAFIQPGRPMQNAFIERFNRSYRVTVRATHPDETANV
jgi:putative transposase